MGGNTIFRRPVHLISPDLYLEGLTGRSDQGRMKGLVHIWLRHGDVILEPAGDRFIHFMNDTQRRIAVLDRVHDNPHCKQIVYLIQGLILVHHFLINAEEMFDPPGHIRPDTGLDNMGLHLVHDTLDIFFPGTFAKRDLLHQIIVDIRLQIF